ncbi:MAG TPA: flagellar basal body rod protein FlgB [Verrucomicrobiae bacterium]|jgi:flagellar basal-body rod protein FlgB|nr:flagellar basal body rod protein FlgB [Verrucomicrobiae bacterium]
MIDGLFNQPSYLAAKKTLDAVALRQDALASNIANLETPGYKRIDLAPSFQTELARASAAGDASQISELQPTLAQDTTATAVGPDGNNVSLENEMLQMNQNTLLQTLETQLVSNNLSKMRLAITGR